MGVSGFTDDAPTAIVPTVAVDGSDTESEQELWFGRGSYVIEDRSFDCDARLYRRWHPEPGVVLVTRADEPGVGDAFPDALSDLMFDGLDVEGVVQVGYRIVAVVIPLGRIPPLTGG